MTEKVFNLIPEFNPRIHSLKEAIKQLIEINTMLVSMVYSGSKEADYFEMILDKLKVLSENVDKL